ncbi:MAG: type II CRISPR-associated endonuclease Cas1 [Acidobacteria bacterium]|nr:type II CRISPR-associated endonuclease Cas1 [Acidobacteriota bacterium]
MTERVIEIADGPARLHVRLEQLVIERDGQPEVTTPLAELAALVLTNPRVQLTQAVISGIAVAGGSVVICDRNYLPAAMMLPLQSHFLQTERLARQTQISAPLRKRLWQQIVQAKIKAQSRLLTELHGDDGGLKALAAQVRSGDPENIEAQAARRYWRLLFASTKFRRDREAPDQNRHLNYGYTVLRAIVSRAICGAGFHPSIGLQHRNRYDPFSLAADLMEPFRPLVDRAVALWIQEHDPLEPLDPEAKEWLVGSLQFRFEVNKEERTLFDIFARMASSLAQVLLGSEARLELPEVRGPCGG